MYQALIYKNHDNYILKLILYCIYIFSCTMILNKEKI